MISVRVQSRRHRVDDGSERETLGALSFELSSGKHALIVNCGAPQGPSPEWRRVARATAANSTVTVNDTSSAKFLDSRFAERYLDGPPLSGPKTGVGSLSSWQSFGRATRWQRPDLTAHDSEPSS